MTREDEAREQEQLLKWNVPANLRWLADQSDRPGYMPCGELTGRFLILVAEKLEALSRPSSPASVEVERLKEALEPFAKWIIPCEETVSGWRFGTEPTHDDFKRAYYALASLPTARAAIGEVAAQHFKVGDRVTKVKGLPFGNGDARVVAVYSAEGGPRIVVQHPEGWQHIFAPDQLALASLQSSGREQAK